jgi:EKC/KEOPS complex subunit CGI121/TPRKB
MAAVQTLHLSHLSPALEVHVALFSDLLNAGFLRDQLLAGNSEFEYALIDASMVSTATI